MIRGVGLRGATAVNVAGMIGAGPLITIPLIIAAQHGSVSIVVWIAGALIVLCDGLVNAELASCFPRSGWTYAYLRSAFEGVPGRLAAFLFVWQGLFIYPLSLASGYIGFAQYASSLAPQLASWPVVHLMAIAIGAVVLLALLRTIPRVAVTAIVLAVVAIGTLAVVALAGLFHPTQHLGTLFAQALDGRVGLGAFGAALVIVYYDYAGYTTACSIGDEIVDAPRTMPRAIVASIALVAAAYVALNLGVFAAIPIAAVATSTSVATLVVERTLGHGAAIAITVAVLVTAAASTYSLLLGASRVLYAAALDGNFFPAFARLHPRLRLPHFGLIALGLTALPLTLLPLDAVINAVGGSAVVVAGLGANLALAAVRRRGTIAPFRVPLYPLAPLLTSAAWLFIFWSSGTLSMIAGSAMLAAGAIVFFATGRAHARALTGPA